MNWRFIINTVIIVLILHFILENLDLKIEIGSKELFATSSPSSKEKLNAEESLKFLTENTVEGFDPRQDLLDYIQNKTTDIRGDGFYKTDYNTPHFDSNLTDVQSFYNINADTNDCSHFGFDGINLHNMLNQKEGATKIEGFKNREQKNNYQNINPQYQPEEWSYKNDFPMNGGQQEGVVGYTKIEDDYAPVGRTTDSFLQPNAFQKCTGETFDLRYNKQNFED